MAVSGNIKTVASIGGQTFTATSTRSAEGALASSVSLPVGQAGTLGTRTDDDTGVAVLTAGHGITDSDYVDVYWADGVRYGMDVTATTATDVSIDVGDGDNLPDASTVIVVTKRVTIDEDFDGDILTMIAINSTQRAHLEFEEADGTEVAAQELKADEPWCWHDDLSYANPLTGNAIGKIQASNGSSTTAATLHILGIKDTV